MAPLREITDTDLDPTRPITGSPSQPPVDLHDDSTAPTLRRGALVGRYLIIDPIGSGGMGEVFSAYDPQLDRRIALKLVKLGPREDTQNARDRLLREAQAMAKLSHPNVVSVYDAGTHGARVFIAMEYIEGRTMRNWLDEPALTPDPSARWPEALQLMIQAGHGLAAAHAQGLVHRDFKPANIMVSHDGRVRVLDFGLARRFDELDLVDREPIDEPELTTDSLDGPSGSRSSLSMRLTQTGMVMGTPSYMAPEQFFEGSIDERTDQFSFCVVLYRALFGERPFPGDTFEELGKAVAQGKLRPLPRTTRVPRHIQTALQQGLSVNPLARHASMDDLLAILEHRPGWSRRRMGWIAGVTLAAGLGGTWVLSRADPPAPPPCAGAEAKLAGIWDDTLRQTMAASFAAAELPYAQDARIAAEQSLDRYAQHWVRRHTQICEATRVRGDQSEALMDLRIGCLDGGLRKVGALTQMFAAADATVVENAVQSARALPPLDECTTLDRDDRGLLRPDDDRLAQRVEQIRDDIAAAWALESAGKYEEALHRIQPTLEAARSTTYRPAIAEAALSLGHIHARNMQAEPSAAAYEQALYAAAASGHARIEARALIGLLSVVGMHPGQTDAALHYGNHAAAVLERLGTPPDLEALVALHRGNTLMAANRLEQATEQFERAITLTEQLPAAERVYLAALNNMAAVQGRRGRYRDAVALFEQALALTEARLGSRHPFVGQYYNNLGITYSQLEDYEAASTHLEHALEIYAEAFGPDHPELGRASHNLGVVQAARGDIEAAYISYHEALKLKIRGLGPDHPSVALSANNLGDTLIQLDRPAEAIAYIEDALRIWTKARSEDDPGNVLSLVSLGEAHLALGQPDRAEPPIRRALRLAEGVEIDPAQLAKAQFVAARAIWRASGRYDEARTLARQARKGYEASDRPSAVEIAQIDAWLATPQ
ncbi:MAG: serine/threonine-protein kinase [Myxococcota bacterium]